MAHASAVKLIAARIAVMIAVLAVAAVVGHAPTQVAVAGATDWARVDTGPFSIALPPCWRYVPLHGTDTLVGQFVGDGITLGFDYGGWAAGPFDEYGRYVVARETIDARVAEIDVPCDPNGKFGLFIIPGDGAPFDQMNLIGQCVPLERQADVLAIFRSLRFR